MTSNPTSPAPLSTRVPSSDLPQPTNPSPRLSPDHRLAESKTHHRQTSIVHGIQHSRNGSFASPTSLLSPQMIASAGAERPDASVTGDPSFASTSPSMTSTSTFSSSATLVPERVSPGADSNTSPQTRVERMQSGRSRRGLGHHQSHSRHHHKEELKTVGEYALHVLFTSVSPFNMFHCKRPNNTAPVHCPGRGENFTMYYCSPGSRTSDRSNMWSGCRSDV